MGGLLFAFISQFFFRKLHFLNIQMNWRFQAFVLFFIFTALVTTVLLYNALQFDTISALENFNFYFNFPLIYGFEIYYFPFIYIFLFITLLSIIFCLAYNYQELNSFLFFCFIIFVAGLMIFLSSSFLIFFFAYEMLLLPSFFILYFFAKTRRSIEAAYLMFFWTQFGALFLIISFLVVSSLTGSSSFDIFTNFSFSNFEINFLFFSWLIGFGVKLPIWPFYGWLPKAHVEASTNFSIFLSGVLVKLAFFGFFKCLLELQNEPTLFLVYPFLTIGITDAIFKMFYQIDLKKLVAYSTVVEMHWLTICIISGNSPLLLANFCMLISHALLSSNSFLIVDMINRRFKTRLITEISGINFSCPKLFFVALLNLLIFLGFPGSIFFISEVLFFLFFWDLFPILATILFFILYFLGPTFFFRNWFNTLFGLSSSTLLKAPLDLNLSELLLSLSLSVFMFWLGITWQFFLL